LKSLDDILAVPPNETTAAVNPADRREADVTEADLPAAVTDQRPEAWLERPFLGTSGRTLARLLRDIAIYRICPFGRATGAQSRTASKRCSRNWALYPPMLTH
jgi:hypothetical protein